MVIGARAEATGGSIVKETFATAAEAAFSASWCA
jgi:hypothetical protein